MNTVKEALIAAREVIRSPFRWFSANASAVDGLGCRVDPKSDDAVAWSTVGAFQRAVEDAQLRSKAADALVRAAGRTWHVQLNTGITHRELMEAFEKAIEAA
jgi:hypothetical protein